RLRLTRRRRQSPPPSSLSPCPNILGRSGGQPALRGQPRTRRRPGWRQSRHRLRPSGTEPAPALAAQLSALRPPPSHLAQISSGGPEGRQPSGAGPGRAAGLADGSPGIACDHPAQSRLPKVNNVLTEDRKHISNNGLPPFSRVKTGCLAPKSAI